MSMGYFANTVVVSLMDNQVGGLSTYLLVISYYKQNSDVCVLVKFTKLTKKLGTLLHNTCHGKTAVRSFIFFKLSSTMLYKRTYRRLENS